MRTRHSAFPVTGRSLALEPPSGEAGLADRGLVDPQAIVTRDQMAVYVARAFGLTV